MTFANGCAPGPGRPSSYTQEVGDLICQRIATGISLRTICNDDDMPDRVTVIRWKQANETFRAQYARAREEQAETWADEILDIADDAGKDFVIKDGVKVVNSEHISRSRLRVDTRKWIMSKLKPGTYGDKVQHTNAAGDGDMRVEVVLVGE